MKLEDWLYSETDDTCAVRGIRGSQILTVHHTDNNRSNNVYDNKIIICHNCHLNTIRTKGWPASTLRAANDI